MRGKNSVSLPHLSVISDTGEELEVSESIISPLAPALTPTFRSQNLSPFWFSSVASLPQLSGYTSDGPGQSTSPAPLSMLHAAAITGDTEGLAKLASGKFCDLSLRDKFGRTPLMYGVLGNYPECVQILLREGADQDVTDSSGRTALHWAAHHGYGACARLLTRADSGWDRGDQAGVTVLHLAMRHDKTVLQLLLRKYKIKEKVNILDINKRSPLHWACALGNYEQAKSISKLGAEIGLIDVEGKTALHWAVTSCSTDPIKLVKLLVNMKTASKTTVGCWQDYEGRQALHLAVLANNLQMVEAVLEEKKSCMMNGLDHRGRTALHWAAVRGLAEVVRRLLEAGANPDLRDETGATATHLAVQSASLQTLQVLVSCGHHVLLDSQGRTPLMWAVAGGKEDMVMLFTDVDLDTKDKLGCSAVHIAVGNNLAGILECLVGLGADINLADLQGETGLMMAARMGSQEVAELLVRSGAGHRAEALQLASAHGNLAIVRLLLMYEADNVNSVDSAGRSPLIMASYGGYKDIVVLLLDSQADIDQQDRDGMCALHWAVRRGHLEVVRILLNRGAFTNNIGRHLTPLDSASQLELSEIVSLLQKHKAVTITRIYNIAATRIQAFYRGYKIRNTYTEEVKNLMVKHMKMVMKKGDKKKKRRRRSRRHKSGELDAETDLPTSEKTRIAEVAGEFLGSVVEGHQRSSYLRRVQQGEDEPLPREERHRDILSLPLTGKDRPDSHFSYNLNK